MRFFFNSLSSFHNTAQSREVYLSGTVTSLTRTLVFSVFSSQPAPSVTRARKRTRVRLSVLRRHRQIDGRWGCQDDDEPRDQVRERARGAGPLIISGERNAGRQRCCWLSPASCECVRVRVVSGRRTVHVASDTTWT